MAENFGDSEPAETDSDARLALPDFCGFLTLTVALPAGVPMVETVSQSERSLVASEKVQFPAAFALNVRVKDKVFFGEDEFS